MAPQKPADKRIQAIIDFALQTHRSLQDRSATPSRQDLEANIKLLPSLSAGASGRELDAIGAELWNVSNGIVSGDEPPEIIRVGVRVRVFALLLLDAALRASQRRSKDRDEQIRILKIATRASRLCLEKDELDLALVTLEICSQHCPAPAEAPPLMQLSRDDQETLSERDCIVRNLAGELILLRLHHAWKSNRSDLADHFFSKLELSASTPILAHKAADLFYELSRSFSRPANLKDAIIWLDRAFVALISLDPEILSQEAAELLLSVGISLLDDLLSINNKECRHRAAEICEQLKNTHCLSNRITIPVARVRLLLTEQHIDADQLSTTLLQIIKMVILTEDSFVMIMQTLHKAAKASRVTVLPLLKTFIGTRLLPELGGDNDRSSHVYLWTEKAAITYIHLATSGDMQDASETLDQLQELLDRLHSSPLSVFTTKATHAAQTLIWKASGETDQNLLYRWCDLLRHRLFENAGHLNKARIGRKLMRLAMDDGKLQVAREAFFDMPSAAQNDPLSRYRSFKLALRTGDENLAMTSLGIIMKATPRDPTYIYACVLESQQSSMRHMAVVALQSILDQRPHGIHLPSLLRCTARLLMTELKTADEAQIDLTEVLGVFETAAKCIDDLRQSNQWRAEIQWWSKNTYNLAIRLCGKIDSQILLSFLDVCLQFLEAYPNDIGLMQQDEVGRRKLLCAFLATTALIVMGRTGDQAGEEYVQQCYLHAQQRIEVYRTLHKKLKDAEPDQEAMKSRTFSMLKFDLECILQLKQWEKLQKALEVCLNAEGVGRWDALADLLIIVHRELDQANQDSHTAMMTQLLQRMINDSWKKEKDITKVARWLRFTFTLCLDHTHGDFSLKLLQQAASMAENGYRGKHDPYPDSELQWLAATSFNHAVDLLGAGDKTYLTWIDAALDIARWSQDNGALHAIFTQKRAVAVEQGKELIK